MVTEIVLIRHAESEMNTRPGELVGGRSNHTPLSAAGRQAAAALGHRLREEPPPDAFYCTSAVRSRETAHLVGVGAEWGLPRVCDELLELSQGSAEGRPRSAWWTAAEVKRMEADPLHHRLAPDAENHAEVQRRMTRALQRLATHHGNARVVAIGHGIAMRSLAWSLAGGDHAGGFQAVVLPNLACMNFLVDEEGHLRLSAGPRTLEIPGATLYASSMR